ncbi:MAG: hypothetical protein IH623_22650 [Verrucomicrobia bacterium]|nr:hypothetical protein [Verrucomicrobiota bacterium]
MKRAILIVCALVSLLTLLIVLLTIYFPNRSPGFLAHPPDHGLTFVIEVDVSSGGQSTNALAELKHAIHQRATKLGYRVYWEALPETRTRVTVNAGSVDDSESISRALFHRGLLEFRILHEDNDGLLAAGEVPPGYELLAHEVAPQSGVKRTERLLVKESPEPGLTGILIKMAVVAHDHLGMPQIDFVLTPAGAAAFARVTRDNVGRRLAMVLDGEVQTAPVIRSPIDTGRAQITGDFDLAEAFGLANMLEHPLPVQVTVLETKRY